jgi:hypothetical protein
MIWINCLRFGSAQPRVAQPHRLANRAPLNPIISPHEARRSHDNKIWV